MSHYSREQQIKQAIEGVFSTYDIDKSNTLDISELRSALAETFKKMGVKKQVTAQDIKNLMSTIDKNDDGKVTKSQLYQIFKKVTK